MTSGDVISGDATSGYATSGDVISGDATSGRACAHDHFRHPLKCEVAGASILLRGLACRRDIWKFTNFTIIHNTEK